MSYFARLFRGKLVRQWSHVWDALVSYSSDLYPAELIDDIEQAYQEGLVDPGYIDFDDVQRDVAEGKDRVLARLADNPHRTLVEDTVREMGWWACFQDDGRSRTKAVSQAPRTNNLGLAPTAAPAQVHRPNPKTGRNEPCPRCPLITFALSSITSITSKTSQTF